MSVLSTQPRSAHRLVLFHGLASTPKEFGLLVHPLRRLGVMLVTPEVPGYSHGMLAEPARWRDWVKAAAHVVEVETSTSSEPVILGGLCTGAMLAVAAAAAQPHPRVRGLALLSPLFAYDGWALPWWYRLRHLAYALGLSGRFSMQERPPYGLKNERMRQWVRQQLQTESTSLVGPAQVSLQVVRESERLSRHALACLPKLALPVKMLHAREDEICSLRSVQRAAALVPAERLGFEVLEDSYHMITADNDRQQVARSVADFVAGCLATPRRATPDFLATGRSTAATRVEPWTPSTISSN
jgi:carboxylesterase